MLEWASGVYNWAREDEKFVGLAPWHMTGPAVPDAQFAPGLEHMPALLDAYKTIGREIVSGRLGDVSFV